MYGESTDVNTNSVVLKVNGDLTLDTGYTLTSVKNGTAVGKGLFIYCTGTLTIDGTVNMSSVTCTAPEQNVYLWKNKTGGDFKYIRKNGGTGGVARNNGVGYGYSFTYTETNGTVKNVNDNHWISGGGGGGHGGIYSTPGGQGSSWVGGFGRRSSK